MGVISIRLGDNQTNAIKRIALSQNKKISVMCRDIISQYLVDNLIDDQDGKNWQKSIESRLDKIEQKIKDLDSRSSLFD